MNLFHWLIQWRLRGTNVHPISRKMTWHRKMHGSSCSNLLHRLRRHDHEISAKWKYFLYFFFYLVKQYFRMFKLFAEINNLFFNSIFRCWKSCSWFSRKRRFIAVRPIYKIYNVQIWIKWLIAMLQKVLFRRIIGI